MPLKTGSRLQIAMVWGEGEPCYQTDHVSAADSSAALLASPSVATSVSTRPSPCDDSFAFPDATHRTVLCDRLGSRPYHAL